MDWSVSLFLRKRWQISVLILPIYRIIIWALTWVWINSWQTHKWLLCRHIYAPCVFFWEQVSDPPMYIVASAVLCRSLAIVWSLPLPGCGNCHWIIRSDCSWHAHSDDDLSICHSIWSPQAYYMLLNLLLDQPLDILYHQMAYEPVQT